LWSDAWVRGEAQLGAGADGVLDRRRSDRWLLAGQAAKAIVGTEPGA